MALWLPASLEPGALDAKPVESPGEPGQLTRKGRKRKTVTWPEEGKLREYFYFELDETERGNGSGVILRGCRVKGTQRGHAGAYLSCRVFPLTHSKCE